MERRKNYAEWRKLDEFEEGEIEVSTIESNQMHYEDPEVIDTSKNLPHSWLQQPIITTTNQFERGNVPYTFDQGGVYCGDYKMSVQPIIVEKEVIKEVYLTPVTPFSAAVEMYKRMKGEVSEGKQIYRDDSGRIVSR